MYEGGSKTLKPYIYNYCFNYYNSKTFQIFYNMFLICEDTSYGRLGQLHVHFLLNHDLIVQR